MERRSDGIELLDGRLDSRADLDGNLRDLGRVNRWLGGVALSASGIDSLAPGAPHLTLLDVGTGGADIPMALLARAARRGQALSVTAVDSRAEIIAAAIRVTPALATTPGLTLQTGDGLRLDHADGTFDVVHCSLVLHHCSPEEAVRLLREMARVARSGVVINDLDRTQMGLLGAWLMAHLLTANRYTRQDAPMSVRRAYRPREVVRLIEEAGLRPTRVFRATFRYRYAIVAVRDRPDG
jgi:ubiquinone/menaquinone biosynthesis C-methylase UbiE